MKAKRLISVLTVATLIMANSVSVFAATPKVTVENADTGYTASTDVTATITAEMLGADVVVTVPSTITLGTDCEVDLTSESDYLCYSGTTWATLTGSTAGKDHVYLKGVQVTAKGQMPDNKRLYISVVPENGIGSDYLKLTNTTNSNLVIKPTVMSNPGEGNSTRVTDNAGVKHRAMYYSLSRETVAASHVADNEFMIVMTNKGMPAVGTYTGTLNYFVAMCDDEDGFKAALVAPYNN